MKEKEVATRLPFLSANAAGQVALRGQLPLVGPSPLVGKSNFVGPVNPQEFRRAKNAHVAMTTYVNTPASEIFNRFKGPFWRHFSTFFHFHP